MNAFILVALVICAYYEGTSLLQTGPGSCLLVAFGPLAGGLVAGVKINGCKLFKLTELLKDGLELPHIQEAYHPNSDPRENE